jgi:hypothetical protein
LIFSDGFESGSLSMWDASITDNGDLSVSSQAAIQGSYGLSALLDDRNVIYVEDFTPIAEVEYRARFYLDPNTLVMSNGNAFYPLQAYNSSNTAVARIEFRYFNNSYQLRAGILTDALSWKNTAWFAITDAPTAIEIHWRAATTPTAKNGAITLWISGTQKANLGGVDNDGLRVESVQLGAVAGIDNGTRGTFYLDSFISSRFTYIGP